MSVPFHARWGAVPEAKAVVAALASSPETRDHGLSDVGGAVAYGELPELFARLDARFGDQGLRPAAPVAFECPQTVAGGVALLYFLDRGYDLVLLPELGEGAKEAGTPRFIPDFCSHVVSAADPGNDDAELRVETNLEHAPEPLVEGFRGPDVYLRTSGSTGVPKLARMSHGKWLANALGCVERWGLVPDDRLMVPVPIFHSYGFGAAYLPGLLAGASMELLGSFNVLRYLEREESFAPNVAFLTPALCDMFVRVRRTPRSYKLAVTAGDKIRAETVAAFEPRFGPLLNLYGSAEMGAVSSAAPEDPPATRLGTAGYALPGIELRLDGSAENTDSGTTGALFCRQPHGFAGYLYPHEGRWRFDPHDDDAWFKTGDLARLRDDGYLELLGRASLSVKRDGLLVVFADLEARIETLGGLARAVVFTAGETPRGPRLVAACQRAEQHKTGAAPDSETLRRLLFTQLPRYAVPDEVVLVDTLPQLPNGKVDRRAVPEWIRHHSH